MAPPGQRSERGGRRRRAVRLLGGIATAGAVAIAAAAVIAPPPASAQGPAVDRTTGASRASRDGPLVPPGLGGPPAGAVSGPPAPVRSDPCGARAGPTRPIALNSAGRAELEELPGIGPAKAQRIVDWRTRHGRFRRILDLRRVNGFGRKTVLRLAPYLVLDAPAEGQRPASVPPAAARQK